MNSKRSIIVDFFIYSLTLRLRINLEHDLVQEYPIHQSHVLIQVSPISCSQWSKCFNLEQKDYHDVNAHLHLCSHK